MTGQVGTLLSDMEPDTTDWLWRGWLPLGCVTWFVGPGGLGKSTIMNDIISRVTRGDAMPDGSPCESPGGVVLISLEEQMEQTVLPRAIAAKALLGRVVDLHEVERQVRRPGDPARSPFDISQDLDVLEQAIKRVNASLVVIDPFMCAVGTVHTWGNQAASKVFMSLQGLAERLGVSVVIVNHFTKAERERVGGGGGGTATNPLINMAGSKGLSDRSRSAIMLSADASDPSRCVLSLVKHSLSAPKPQIVLQHNGANVVYLTGVTLEQELINRASAMEEAREQVQAILAGSSSQAFTVTTLAQQVGVDYDVMKIVLRRMQSDGLVVKTLRGFYRGV